MFYADFPIVLEVTPDERDRALTWLISHHPQLEYLVEDADDGAAEIRVHEHDAAILDSVADMLERE